MTDAEYAQHRKDLLYYLKCLGVFAWKHAEDICQECLIALHLRLQDPMAQPLRDTRAWLRSVAWHRLTDLFRFESRLIPLSESPESEESWVGVTFIDYMDPERQYIAREELEQVAQYIDPREYGPDELPSSKFRKRLERFRQSRKEHPHGYDRD